MARRIDTAAAEHTSLTATAVEPSSKADDSQSPSGLRSKCEHRLPRSPDTHGTRRGDSGKGC